MISQGGFIALAGCLLHERGLDFSSDIFGRFDANHDNAISREEMINRLPDLAL